MKNSMMCSFVYGAAFGKREDWDLQTVFTIDQNKPQVFIQGLNLKSA